jgi:hypothetical protein
MSETPNLRCSRPQDARGRGHASGKIGRKVFGDRTSEHYNIVNTPTTTILGELVRYLSMLPLDGTAPVHDREFVTFEDELPAEVAMSPDGPLERVTRFTDVKTETTDDN